MAHYFLAYAAWLSALVPVAASQFKRSTCRSISTIVIILVGWSFLADTVSLILSRSFETSNNYPVLNIFNYGQYVLLFALYARAGLGPRAIMITSIVTLLIAAAYENLYCQNLLVYQSHIRFIGGLIMVSMSILCYWNMLKNVRTDSWNEHRPIFWMNTGVFWYFSFNTLLFFLDHIIFTNLELATQLLVWSFHNINSIVKNAMFAIGVYHNRAKS